MMCPTCKLSWPDRTRHWTPSGECKNCLRQKRREEVSQRVGIAILEVGWQGGLPLKVRRAIMKQKLIPEGYVCPVHGYQPDLRLWTAKGKCRGCKNR